MIEGELFKALTITKETLETYPRSWELDTYIKQVIRKAKKEFPMPQKYESMGVEGLLMLDKHRGKWFLKWFGYKDE